MKSFASFSLRIVTILAAITFAYPASSRAHNFEPGLLSLRETSASTYTVVWQPPASSSGFNLSGRPIAPEFDPACTADSMSASSTTAEATTHVWHLRCDDGLPRHSLTIAGLDGTQVDVVLRIVWRDGRVETAVLQSGASTYIVPSPAGDLAYDPTASGYLRLGILHILTGYDHLAFVIGLFLLAPSRRDLLKTITAFTLGHSLTLALATLRWVLLPNRLTEALIALSIVLVAREALVTSEFPGGPTPNGSRRFPTWIIASTFGFLHGLGFAAALGDLGLQGRNVALALLSFNAGVEVGQILFVATLVVSASVLHAPARRWPASRLLVPYALGTASTIWLLERILAFGAAAS